MFLGLHLPLPSGNCAGPSRLFLYLSSLVPILPRQHLIRPLRPLIRPLHDPIRSTQDTIRLR